MAPAVLGGDLLHALEEDRNDGRLGAARDEVDAGLTGRDRNAVAAGALRKDDQIEPVDAPAELLATDFIPLLQPPSDWYI